MSNAEVCEVKIARQQGSRRRRGPSAAPRDPDKVFKIIDLRDNQELSWEKISVEIGETRQGPYLLYKKWHDWAEAIIREAEELYKKEEEMEKAEAAEAAEEAEEAEEAIS
jgi:hypothetical protein